MSQHSTVGVLVVALALGGVVATGCSVINKVKQTVHNVEGNKATIDSFTQNLQSGQTTSVRGDLHDVGQLAGDRCLRRRSRQRRLAFHVTADRRQRVERPVHRELVRQLRLHPERVRRAWSCKKLDKADAADQENIFDFYTPSHWVNFLKGVSLVAGLAGDKVSTSTMSLNGFDMSCVDLVAQGVPGTSTICSTSQNILGYVKVAPDSTSFAITNYSGSPASSLFQLPPGATVTTVTTPTHLTPTT